LPRSRSRGWPFVRDSSVYAPFQVIFRLRPSPRRVKIFCWTSICLHFSTITRTKVEYNLTPISKTHISIWKLTSFRARTDRPHHWHLPLTRTTLLPRPLQPESISPVNFPLPSHFEATGRPGPQTQFSRHPPLRC